MKKVAKKQFAFVMAVIMIITMAMGNVASAAEDAIIEATENYEDITFVEIENYFAQEAESQGRLQEFKELVSALAAGRQVERFSIGECLDTYPYTIPVYDVRFNALRELNELMLEAGEIQSGARGQEPVVIMSLFAEPTEYLNTFFIAFTDEKFFELIDFVSVYTGITRDELEVTVIPQIVISIPDER